MKKTSEDELERILGQEQVLRQEPMSEHTSFRVGGPADYFLRVHTVGELQQVLRVLQAAGESYFFLGRGTNLLVADSGYRGAVITFTGRYEKPVTDTAEELTKENPSPVSAAGCSDETGDESAEAGHEAADGLVTEAVQEPGSAGQQDLQLDGMEVHGTRITAGAGASLAGAAVLAMRHGLSGLEFAAGIPGSVGGGLAMNAGAYDGCMQQVVESAKLLMPDGKIRDASNEDMRFAYRRSVLKEIPAVALEAVFRLTPQDPAAIREKMQEFGRRRHEKQPLEYPSAGSTFKRPEGYFAGKLIQDAGLAGYTVGGACVSTKHCGFVINKDHARAADIRQVIADVQQKVFADSGVRLEPEVIFLGDFQ